jgi:hypothetical protein
VQGRGHARLVTAGVLAGGAWSRWPSTVRVGEGWVKSCSERTDASLTRSLNLVVPLNSSRAKQEPELGNE